MEVADGFSWYSKPTLNSFLRVCRAINLGPTDFLQYAVVGLLQDRALVFSQHYVAGHQDGEPNALGQVMTWFWVIFTSPACASPISASMAEVASD